MLDLILDFVNSWAESGSPRNSSELNMSSLYIRKNSNFNFYSFSFS